MIRGTPTLGNQHQSSGTDGDVNGITNPQIISNTRTTGRPISIQRPSAKSGFRSRSISYDRERGK